MPIATLALDPSLDSPLERLLCVLAPEVERRRQARVAAPYLFTLTALADLGHGRTGEEQGPPITVVGKDISRNGLGFYHEEPLSDRYVRLKCDDPEVGCMEIDVQLNRCRFTTLGWYESGGRVIAVRN